MRQARLDSCNDSKMSPIITIRLARPIASAKLLNGAVASTKTFGRLEDRETEPDIAGAASEKNKKGFAQMCRALQDAVNKINELQENMFRKHKEQIAKLSVEIAGKILVHKIQKGDYEIEAIVKEALENAPTRQDVVVHLNPEDLVQCEKLQQNNPSGSLTGIKLVGDPNIGRAECLLETPKGIIESSINEHLNRIGEALIKVK